MNMEAAGKRVHVIQGEYKVFNDPNIVLSTILGSCVAACMRDPVAGVGGMNHFLLPGSATSPAFRRRRDPLRGPPHGTARSTVS